MSDPYDPAEEGTKMSFANDMSYGDYLGLDTLLSVQMPLSTAHDEMLFIVQHQVSELWLRLAIHELNATRIHLANGKIRPAFKILARVARIFEQLNNAWDVLRTMTPSEYTQFRDDLGRSSGFQSHQYRLVEFVVGNRNPAMLKPHEHRPEIHKLLTTELDKPSLYDEVIRMLALKGFAVPTELITRDVTATIPFSQDIQDCWQEIYQDTEKHWELYELAEKLVDFEDYFRRWRFNHVTTVERIIGDKRGSGGSSGVSYLKRMLDVSLFPELWKVRTAL